jgi:hypothetical protein
VCDIERWDDIYRKFPLFTNSNKLELNRYW